MKRGAEISADEHGSRKRSRALIQAHNLLAMCLTESRRIALSAIWAAKLLRPQAGRQMAAARSASWHSFSRLQLSFLHKAVTAPLSAKLCAMPTQASSDRKGDVPESVPATGAEAAATAGPQAVARGPTRSNGMGGLHGCEPSDTLANRADAVGLCGVSDMGPSQSASCCGTLPPTLPTGKAGVGALDRGSGSCGSAGGAATPSGAPSALFVAAADNARLAALASRRQRARVVVARTQSGPPANMQELTASDLARLLQNGTWLNDEVINFYMLLIRKRNDQLYQTEPAPAPATGADASGSTAARAAPASAARLPAPCAQAAKPVAAGLARGAGGAGASGAGAGRVVCQPAGTGAAAQGAGPGRQAQAAGGANGTASSRLGLNATGQAHALTSLPSGVVAGASAAGGSGSSSPVRPGSGGPDSQRTAPSGSVSSPAAAAGAGACGGATAGPRGGTCRPPRLYTFNSFFFAKLTGDGNRRRFEYQDVRRWTLPLRTHTPDCVLTRELLLFPINHGNSHWCLAAVWPRRRLLQYFDSLGGSAATADWVLGVLLRWLLTDAEDKGVALGSVEANGGAGVPLQPPTLVKGKAAAAGWRKERVAGHLPRQLDGSSCGVFVCAFAELLARGVPPEGFRFSQADIPSIRRGMAEQILRTAL